MTKNPQASCLEAGKLADLVISNPGTGIEAGGVPLFHFLEVQTGDTVLQCLSFLEYGPYLGDVLAAKVFLALAALTADAKRQGA